jgi:hypothetical protein
MTSPNQLVPAHPSELQFIFISDCYLHTTGIETTLYIYNQNDFSEGCALGTNQGFAPRDTMT